jgi:hypothetical protein
MATPGSTATEMATATATPLPETTTPVATDLVVEATAEATATTAAQPSALDGLAASPGLLFFLGGTTVLVGGFVLWWFRR